MSYFWGKITKNSIQNQMEWLVTLVQILFPSAIVLYAMYLTVRSFAQKEIKQLEYERDIRLAQTQERKVELAMKTQTEVLPIRLQAYERMILFLERISPAQLILRLNQGEIPVAVLHYLLLQEIRNEYGHNVSQQMYMSDEAWDRIKKAMEETVVLINNSAIGLDEEAVSTELAKRILGNVREYNLNFTGEAIEFLKDEVRKNFF
jgi:hypothetical protein